MMAKSRKTQMWREEMAQVAATVGWEEMVPPRQSG